MAHPRRPKLGQHFLADAGFRRRIVEALDVRADELLVEIGAGRGAMTGLLAERARHVVAIEFDAALVGELRQEFEAEPRIEVVQADILETDLAELARQRGARTSFVFGNLPFYITSPILRHLFGAAPSIRSMALVMQHEVARRVTASPGGPGGAHRASARDYGYLSVLAQLDSQPRLRFTIPPGAFAPPPQVRSALVTFEMELRVPDWAPDERTRFLQFVERCFAQKRKNLKNNLAGFYGAARVERALDALRLAASLRAEQLTIERFRDLYLALRNRI